MVLRVKLRSSGRRLTPYVSTVVTSGRVQKAFASQIGRPVGACVKSRVRKGMGAGAIKNAVRSCAKAKSGTKLSL
jgi:hypothetical protein